MSMQQNLTMELCGYKLVKAAQTINKSVLTLAELEFSCAESKILIQGIPFEECQQYKIGQEYQFNFIQSDTATKNTYKVSSVQLDKSITMTQENIYKGREFSENGKVSAPVSINYHTDITLECKYTDFPVNLGDMISIEIEQVENGAAGEILHSSAFELENNTKAMAGWLARNINILLSNDEKKNFLKKWEHRFNSSNLDDKSAMDFWTIFDMGLKLPASYFSVENQAAIDNLKKNASKPDGDSAHRDTVLPCKDD